MMPAFFCSLCRALRLVLVLATAAALPETVIAQTDRVVPDSQAEIQLSFAPIVRKAQPAVVNVFAKQVVQQRRVSPFMDDPFFRRFFGGQGSPFGMPRERVSNSLGSGVIVDPSGLVVTNFHVIRNASEVRVVLSDRRELEAEIVLKDERTDLAVLRIIEGDDAFPYLDFEDSDDLAVGDLVLAIGNPFGVGQTVTSGIVSALARNQVGVTDYQFFIQTDAAINPGNSGGALIDMRGNLVGINTAIYSRSGGSNGIGFAIPANMVSLVVQSARAGGVVRRPWFGARLQSVTADIAEGIGLDRPQGALIAGVHPLSPAGRAGLNVGDVVLTVDGTVINDPDSFGYRFATKGVEGQTTVSVLRGGETFDVRVQLMPPPEDPPRDRRLIEGDSPLAGASVMNLSPAVAEELRIGDTTGGAGVVIANIERGSPAQQIRLRKGDIIVSINDETVESSRQLARMTSRRLRGWSILIDRDGRRIRANIRG